MLPAKSLAFDSQGTRRVMRGNLMMWGKQQAALSLEAVLRWMKMILNCLTS